MPSPICIYRCAGLPAFPVRVRYSEFPVCFRSYHRLLRRFILGYFFM